MQHIGAVEGLPTTWRRQAHIPCACRKLTFTYHGMQGASGQALQNMNLVMGLPEETGLLQQAMFP